MSVPSWVYKRMAYGDISPQEVAELEKFAQAVSQTGRAGAHAAVADKSNNLHKVMRNVPQEDRDDVLRALRQMKKEAMSDEELKDYATGGLGGYIGGKAVGALGSMPFMPSLRKSLGKDLTPKQMADLEKASPELARQFRESGGDVYGGVLEDGTDLRKKGPHYMPDVGQSGESPHRIYDMKSSHDAVAAHEMGHATGLRQNKLYNMASALGGGLGNLARMGSYGYGGAMAMRGRNAASAAEKEEAYRKSRDAGFVGLAGGLPTLGEEARATYRALKYAPAGRRMEYAKVLAPAYGTYVAGLGVPSALQVGLSERARRKASKGSTKKASMQDQRKRLAHLAALEKERALYTGTGGVVGGLAGSGLARVLGLKSSPALAGGMAGIGGMTGNRLNLKKQEDLEYDLQKRAGMGAGDAAMLLGGAALAPVAGALAMRGVNSLMQKSPAQIQQDLKRVLEVHPDIGRPEDPRVQMAYASLVRLNPDYAEDPLIAGPLLKQIVESRLDHTNPMSNPAIDPNIAKNLSEASKTISQINDANLGSTVGSNIGQAFGKIYGM